MSPANYNVSDREQSCRQVVTDGFWTKAWKSVAPGPQSPGPTTRVDDAVIAVRPSSLRQETPFPTWIFRTFSGYGPTCLSSLTAFPGVRTSSAHCTHTSGHTWPGGGPSFPHGEQHPGRFDTVSGAVRWLTTLSASAPKAKIPTTTSRRRRELGIPDLAAMLIDRSTCSERWDERAVSRSKLYNVLNCLQWPSRAHNLYINLLRLCEFLGISGSRSEASVCCSCIDYCFVRRRIRSSKKLKLWAACVARQTLISENYPIHEWEYVYNKLAATMLPSSKKFTLLTWTWISTKALCMNIILHQKYMKLHCMCWNCILSWELAILRKAEAWDYLSDDFIFNSKINENLEKIRFMNHGNAW